MPTRARRESDSSRAFQPIGVFDSGIGGLTVVQAIRDILPRESIFYIGDTARLPYGGKDRQTIERYSLEISGLLLAENAKIIVVACNTASALALPRLQEVLKIPVLGVIAPGSRAAVKQTRNGHIGVVGTRATISSRAYERTINALDPDLQVTSQACPLLVPLIEEAWFDDPVTRDVLHRYLDPLLAAGIDTLVLGCTHYPLLVSVIEEMVGREVRLVDSARNCAVAVQQTLAELQLENSSAVASRLEVALTDSSNPFLQTAEKALALRIDKLETRLVQGVMLSAAVAGRQ